MFPGYGREKDSRYFVLNVKLSRQRQRKANTTH